MSATHSQEWETETERKRDTRTSKELNGLLELKEQLRKLLRKQCMKFI